MAKPAEDTESRRALSPITRRILAVNILALVFLVAGMLYLGQYRGGLISAELAALHTETDLFAAALGEGAIVDAADDEWLNPGIAHRMLRRLIEASGSRARLFSADGALLADSRLLVGPGGLVQIEELPPPQTVGGLATTLFDVYDRLAKRLKGEDTTPVYTENAIQNAYDYEEVVQALSGNPTEAVRSAVPSGMVLSVAVPVQRYKHVLGALMLSKGSHDIDAALLEVRLDILKVFLVVLAVTVLMSIYLAGTIARPILKLAAAAESVRSGRTRQHTIPQMNGRGDEIGELAEALRDMTEALWKRMDAIEGFAADVAHEIKNPLTSLRSAVETAARVQDPDQQRKLMAIIQDDVQRLDRLITDISDASRIDAELSRAEIAPVDVGRMLSTLVDVAATAGGENGARLDLDITDRDGLVVNGMEGRLVQVFRNLIANAQSFSPPDGAITLKAGREDGVVVAEVLDDGPGIPAGQERAVFSRFYSERPEGEKFGTHSGLGLSISQQIVEAHGGSIRAENRRTADGSVSGARFIVRLPVGG